MVVLLSRYPRRFCVLRHCQRFQLFNINVCNVQLCLISVRTIGSTENNYTLYNNQSYNYTTLQLFYTTILDNYTIQLNYTTILDTMQLYSYQSFNYRLKKLLSFKDEPFVGLFCLLGCEINKNMCVRHFLLYVQAVFFFFSDLGALNREDMVVVKALESLYG